MVEIISDSLDNGKHREVVREGVVRVDERRRRGGKALAEDVVETAVAVALVRMSAPAAWLNARHQVLEPGLCEDVEKRVFRNRHRVLARLRPLTKV